MQNECAAYTFDKSRMICVLHASIDKGTTKKRRKQTGVKKENFTLSLPEMTLCANKNRQKRCKREPKCRHANCIRNAEKWHYHNTFFAFLRFRCHNGIFLAIMPRMATKSAKNLKLCCDNERYRYPQCRDNFGSLREPRLSRPCGSR